MNKATCAYGYTSPCPLGFPGCVCADEMIAEEFPAATPAPTEAANFVQVCTCGYVGEDRIITEEACPTHGQPPVLTYYTADSAPPAGAARGEPTEAEAWAFEKARLTVASTMRALAESCRTSGSPAERVAAFEAMAEHYETREARDLFYPWSEPRSNDYQAARSAAHGKERGDG